MAKLAPSIAVSQAALVAMAHWANRNEWGIVTLSRWQEGRCWPGGQRSLAGRYACIQSCSLSGASCSARSSRHNSAFRIQCPALNWRASPLSLILAAKDSFPLASASSTNWKYFCRARSQSPLVDRRWKTKSMAPISESMAGIWPMGSGLSARIRALTSDHGSPGSLR